MRPCIGSSSLLAAIAIAASACEGERLISGPDIDIIPGATFSATVARAEFESANGPAGPHFLYNVWVFGLPLSVVNTYVQVPTSTPVFVRRDGAVVATDASAIHVGDRIRVASAPYESPLLATEVIIER
jgi:hypothetical protein